MVIKLPESYASRMKYNEPLARHTAARIGGAAEMLYIAKESNDELAAVVMAAWQQDVPVRVLGGGANVLISDKGVRGLVVINDVNEVTFGDWHDGRNMAATGGMGLTVLARKCQTRGLAGLEWAASVPGTVGGSVVNNAGAHGSDIRANLCEAVVLEAEHGIHILTLDDLTYGYRTSVLKARKDKRFLVLLAQFSLKPDDPQAILERMEQHVAYRKQTQPPGASLGSIFKNPTGDYAGRLIEAAGLKGHNIGGAQVSPVHGNFLINKANASAADYHSLVKYVQEQVHKHSGISLEMEIELIGEW